MDEAIKIRVGQHCMTTTADMFPTLQSMCFASIPAPGWQLGTFLCRDEASFTEVTAAGGESWWPPRGRHRLATCLLDVENDAKEEAEKRPPLEAVSPSVRSSARRWCARLTSPQLRGEGGGVEQGRARAGAFFGEAEARGERRT